MAEAKGSFAHLILNPGAGGAAASLGRLSEAAREGGIRVGVLEPGEVVKHAALAAAEDGAQVLGVAVERGLPLVVVPTGTLNHFASDLGLDLARPLRALDAFRAEASTRR